jgi:iron(III) transport system permease protein
VTIAGIRSSGRRAPAGLLAAGAVAALLVLLPLGDTALQAVRANPGDAASLLFRPLVGQLLANTLGLLVATICLTGAIGTGAAWCVERTDLPGRRVWAVLAAVPFAIPAFVTSFAWVSLSPALQDFAGALLVVTCSYFPLVYLPVAAALRGMDPALEETARSLGQGAWGSFLRVVLPQLRPALLGGMLLVALNTLVEFGAFALLRFRTFTTEIYAQYRTGLDGPDSAVLAMVLVVLCLLCLWAESRLRGRRRYARVGQGTRRAMTPIPLGRLRIPVLAAFAAMTLLTLGVPLGMLVFWTAQHSAAATTPVLASAGALIGATLSSLWLAGLGAGLTLLLALPLGFLVTRYPGRLSGLLERSAYLAQGVPGIVVALALISLTVQAIRPLYQSTALLVLAYATLFLPLALVSVRAAFAQVQPGLEEAGRTLGLGWAALARRVVLPLAGPGLGAAAAMVFLSVVTELTATLLLAPIGTRTLATQVWANTSSMAFAGAAPFAAVMALVSLLSTWLLARRFGATGLFRAAPGKSG